jgi:hypothetical protein
MELIARNSGRKRQMVYVPEINPASFLFLFEKGTSGYSYSLRQFSGAQVTLQYARDFGCTADDIRRRAIYCYDAPYLDVMRLAEWDAYTVALNELHGLRQKLSPAIPILDSHCKANYHFPLLNRRSFQSLSKASKIGDVRRMLESPRSEDWVTWNVFQLLVESDPEWWRRVGSLATAENPVVNWPTEVPTVHFWRRVSAPTKYESLSRARLANSADPGFSTRVCRGKARFRYQHADHL